MNNVITFAPPSTKPGETMSDTANRQGLYLRAFVQATDEKCGPDVTISLLRFALERAEARLRNGGLA